MMGMFAALVGGGCGQFVFVFSIALKYDLDVKEGQGLGNIKYLEAVDKALRKLTRNGVLSAQGLQPGRTFNGAFSIKWFRRAVGKIN